MMSLGCLSLNYDEWKINSAKRVFEDVIIEKQRKYRKFPPNPVRNETLVHIV
jgi:hypothetical protein